jgi:hypothetical protein
MQRGNVRAAARFFSGEEKATPVKLARICMIALMLCVALWLLTRLRSERPTPPKSVDATTTDAVRTTTPTAPKPDDREIWIGDGPHDATVCDVAYLELQRKLVTQAKCEETEECTLIALPHELESRQGSLMRRWFSDPDLTERQVREFGRAIRNETRGIRRDEVQRFQQTVTALQEACPMTDHAVSVDEGARVRCVEGLCLFDDWMEGDPPPGYE